MFDLAIVQVSTKLRSGTGQCIAEGVATAGLLLVILRAPAGRAIAMVAAYIGAADWFTASTSFLNPAAAFGRMFSESFAGIAPSSVPGFVIAQLVCAAIGLAIHTRLSFACIRQGTPTSESSGQHERLTDRRLARHAELVCNERCLLSAIAVLRLSRIPGQ